MGSLTRKASKCLRATETTHELLLWEPLEQLDPYQHSQVYTQLFAQRIKNPLNF